MISSYFIELNGKSKGPFEISEIIEFLKMSPDALIWKEGDPEWKKAEEFEELIGKIKIVHQISPPPLPKLSKSSNSSSLVKRLELEAYRSVELPLKRSFKSLKKSLLITLPFLAIIYLSISKMENGFEAFSLKQDYGSIPAIGEIKDDKLSKDQEEILQKIREFEYKTTSLMDESGINREYYTSFDNELNYMKFLDDRIFVAFGYPALLKAFLYYLLVNLLGWPLTAKYLKPKEKSNLSQVS